MKTVYLAGPITGVSYAGCTDWREEIQRRLAPGIVGLSPMRAKKYLAVFDSVPNCMQQEAAAAADDWSRVFATQSGIMARDFYDCTHADLVIANLLGATTVSIGTVMEIAWCHATRTPLILVMESEGNLHEHGMLREAGSWRVDNLDDAVRVANAVLLAYVQKES